MPRFAAPLNAGPIYGCKNGHDLFEWYEYCKVLSRYTERIFFVMPEQYLLHIFSTPVKVSTETWSQWYTEEHIRDMVHFKASRTAAVYQATTNAVVSSAGSSQSPYDLDNTGQSSFLALYQTDKAHCLDHPEYKDHVRLHSLLWSKELSCHEAGQFTPTDLELVDVMPAQAPDEENGTHCC